MIKREAPICLQQTRRIICRIHTHLACRYPKENRHPEDKDSGVTDTVEFTDA